jgi:hypothetical protein
VKQQVFKPEAVWKDILNGVNWTEEYEGCWSPVLNIDATLNAEVEAVREKVQNFMKVRAMWNVKGLGLKKFAVFDEADRLGYAEKAYPLMRTNDGLGRLGLRWRAGPPPLYSVGSKHVGHTSSVPETLPPAAFFALIVTHAFFAAALIFA